MKLENNQYLAKVAYKDEHVEMRIACKDEHGERKKIEYSSDQKPHPDFLAALFNLQKAARIILEFSDNYKTHSLNISGISWSYSDSTGITGAVITGTIDLETSNTPFCFNTPHLPYKAYSEGSNTPIMPTFCIKLLNELEKEALAYLEGKRAQADMFVGAN